MISAKNENPIVRDKRTRTQLGTDPADLVALLAFSALAAMTRLAKDSAQAPNSSYQIDHARMSSRAFREFQYLEEYAQQNDLDLAAGFGQFSGLFDELEVRTRPSSWWERSVKSYVVIGIFADALRELSDQHQLLDNAGVEWDFGQGQWERDHFAPLAQRDEQLASRLSLWARRVAGEAIALLRATLFTYPRLTFDPDTVDTVVAGVIQRHQERMEALNLKA